MQQPVVHFPTWLSIVIWELAGLTPGLVLNGAVGSPVFSSPICTNGAALECLQLLGSLIRPQIDEVLTAGKAEACVQLVRGFTFPQVNFLAYRAGISSI